MTHDVPLSPIPMQRIIKVESAWDHSRSAAVPRSYPQIQFCFV